MERMRERVGDFFSPSLRLSFTPSETECPASFYETVELNEACGEVENADYRTVGKTVRNARRNGRARLKKPVHSGGRNVRHRMEREAARRVMDFVGAAQVRR